MNVEELHQRARDATETGNGFVTLILPVKRPRGFPRGELLCEGHDGCKVYTVNASRILKWLKAKGLSPSEEDRSKWVNA